MDYVSELMNPEAEPHSCEVMPRTEGHQFCSLVYPVLRLTLLGFMLGLSSFCMLYIPLR